MKLENWWVWVGLYFVGAFAFPSIGLFAPGAGLLRKLGVVKSGQVQPSSVTTFRTLGGQGIVAPDDTVLGVPVATVE